MFKILSNNNNNYEKGQLFKNVIEEKSSSSSSSRIRDHSTFEDPVITYNDHKVTILNPDSASSIFEAKQRTSNLYDDIILK